MNDRASLFQQHTPRLYGIAYRGDGRDERLEPPGDQPKRSNKT
jgi:hypothetical protein